MSKAHSTQPARRGEGGRPRRLHPVAGSSLVAACGQARRSVVCRCGALRGPICAAKNLQKRREMRKLEKGLLGLFMHARVSAHCLSA